MAGSGAQERVFSAADRYPSALIHDRVVPTRRQGLLGRVTPTLLFRAAVGLVVAFLLLQPAIYLTYREQERSIEGNAAADRALTTAADVQDLLFAGTTM